MPERNQYQVKTLTIDGREVCAAEDQTILEVARENGIDIPTLCHFDGLSEISACSSQWPDETQAAHTWLRSVNSSSTISLRYSINSAEKAVTSIPS